MHSEEHYNNHGKKDDNDFNLHLNGLESFIGLRIARGVLAGNNKSIKQLWSKEWGHSIFGNTMGRNRYQKIMKHLIFNDFLSRRKGDKLTNFA